MSLFNLTADDVLARLGSVRSGLSAVEASQRFAKFGPNRFERVRRQRLGLRFLKSFTHFFALLLWAAAGIAFAAEAHHPGLGMATLGYAIIGVILINGLFAFWQDYRAERLLMALARLLPSQVKAVRNGDVAMISVEAVVPGDVLLFAQGDSVPADCRVIEAYGLKVNNATVTGESAPRTRTAKPVEAPDSLHSDNALLAGTSVVAGEGVAVAFATGRHTEFSKIAGLAQRAEPRPSPFLKEVAFVSRVVAVLATALGAVFFVIGLNTGLLFWQSAMFGIGIIVANVPEGLLPTITLALALGAQRMAKRKVLIRNLPTVEALGSATVICTDKTGTLTENRMAVHAVYPARTLRLATPGELAPMRAAADRRLCEAARWCQTLKRSPAARGGWLGDPMEIALVEMAEAACPDLAPRPLIGVIPFDADRKRLSTIHENAEGRVLYAKGAPEVLLALCAALETDAGPIPFTAEHYACVRAAEEELATQGLRLLALAYRRLAPDEPLPDEESDLVFLALVAFEDPPRLGVREAVGKARDAGVKVIVLTGDHPQTTLALAHEIGLVCEGQATVLTGERLRELTEAELALLLDTPNVLFARLAADQKLRIVRALQAKGHVVAVTGDGVNDAPALKEADIGIAMGMSGSDVARESADMVLVEDNFANIVDAIEEGRAIFDNVRKFMTYILTSNIPEIVPYLAFALFGIPLPLTIIQILAIDLGTDMVPALALGAERPHPEVMRRPPRPRSKRLLDLPLLLRAYLFLGPLEALAALSAYFFVLERGGWSFGHDLATRDPLYLQATTACLAAIVVVQVANVFLCRSETKSVVSADVFANRLILFGVATEAALILFVVYTDWGNAIFGTAPLPWQVWVFALPFAFFMLGAEEARKWLVRKTSHAGAVRANGRTNGGSPRPVP